MAFTVGTNVVAVLRVNAYKCSLEMRLFMVEKKIVCNKIKNTTCKHYLLYLLGINY